MADLFSDFDAGETDTEGRLLPAPRDPCERKHKGNEQSEEAFARVAPTIRESHAAILAWLGSHGPGTAKEWADASGKGFNEVSGRWSELKRDGKIVPTGDRRDGAAVYRTS